MKKAIDHISTLLTWWLGEIFSEAVRKSLSAINGETLPLCFLLPPQEEHLKMCNSRHLKVAFIYTMHIKEKASKYQSGHIPNSVSHPPMFKATNLQFWQQERVDVKPLIGRSDGRSLLRTLQGSDGLC